MGKIEFGMQTDPATPDSGYARVFVDSADKHLKMIDDVGALRDFHATAPVVIVEITSAQSPYTNLDSTDYLFVNATSGNVTVGLNSVLTAVRPIRIVRVDASANTVTIDPQGSQFIIDDNGAVQSTMALGAKQGISLVPLASASTWYRA